jgi:F0F1-type ATP synthase membrane subunit b/b'
MTAFTRRGGLVLFTVLVLLVAPALAVAGGEHGAAERAPGSHAEAPGADHGSAVGVESAHEGGHGEGGGGEHEGGGISEWARAFNFLLLLGLLYALGGKKIPGLLRRRTENILAMFAGAEARRRRHEERLAEVEARRQQLDRDRDQILAEREQSGKMRAEQLLARAREEAQRMAETSRRRRELAEQRLMAELSRLFIEEAMAHADRALEQSLTPEDNALLVDRFIANLEKVKL